MRHPQTFFVGSLAYAEIHAFWLCWALTSSTGRALGDAQFAGMIQLAWSFAE
jgi:hypothetical protein